jgi:hypothetical protein
MMDNTNIPAREQWRINGFVGCISNRHGKFYASFVLMAADVPVQVVIMGPYPTQAKAEWTMRKWHRMNAKRMDQGRSLAFSDHAAAVPDDVRQYITTCLMADCANGYPIEDTVTGKVLQ